VAVPKETSPAAVAAVESLFAWLAKRGVIVIVRRSDDDD